MLEARISDSSTLVQQVTEQSAWNDYLRLCKDGNFYQRFEWQSVNKNNFGHESFFLAALRDGSIVGIFPLVFIKSRLTGKILSSMPFVNFGGITCNDDEARQALLRAAEELCLSKNADYLEVRALIPVSNELNSTLQKVSLTIELQSDPEILWNGFKSKHRTGIRRVAREGIVVRQGGAELIDDFYSVLSASWKYLGTPIYRKSYFRDIIDTFGEDVRIFVAYHGNQAIAVAFNGYFKDTVEGMWAGSLPEVRRLAPNYVLYWEMIKDACERGYHSYHLGRSTIDSGAETFKKKWNANSRQIYYQYLLAKGYELPELNKDNPRFNLAIKIWSRLPLVVTTILGPIIAKNIP